MKSNMLRTKKKGQLYVVSGPSACGKDSIVKKLLEKRNDLWLSISCTSRKPRPLEKDGVDYFFLTKEEFEEKIRQNKLLEYAVNNNLDKDDFIYPNKVRNMQQQLKIITDYLGYKNIGTHSFRKLFAHTLYEESGHDIELVRHVLNHGDIRTTMRYLGVSQKRVKEVIDKIDFSYIL